MKHAKKPDGKNALKDFLGYLIIAVIAVIFSLTIRFFIFELYIVPSPSMEPTLVVRDRVIVSKLTYKFKPIERGDIVVFHSPLGDGKDLVKRAIGIEGDNIKLTSSGDIYINGEKIIEDYLHGKKFLSFEDKTFAVEENLIFVLGDNRDDSVDSRYFGFISEKDIFGRVIFIYWPPSRFGRVNG